MFAVRNIVFLNTVRRFTNEAHRLNYYEILGVKNTATQDEIKKAYYELSKKYHPDITKNETGAKQQFLRVTEAYEILGNNILREKYDGGTLGVGDIASRKSQAASPTTQYEDFTRGARQKQSAMGQTTASNFDNWTKSQYSRMVDHSKETRGRFNREREQEATISFQNKLEVFVAVVFILGAVFVSTHARKHAPPPGPPPKK